MLPARWKLHLPISRNGMVVVQFLITLGLSYLSLGDAYIDGDVKLDEASGQGLLMVYYKGRFGYVCDDIQGSMSAVGEVACRNLNRKFLTYQAGQSHSPENFFLDEVKCNGTESNLDQCEHDSWKTHNCGRTEHVYVQCSDCELGYTANRKLCSTNDFTVDCTSNSGMTIFMEKKTFFFLPDALTLTDTNCTSQYNSTHIWLHTDYNACSTQMEINGDYITYSNAVLDSKNDSGIHFFDSIKIPFSCEMYLDPNIHQGLNPVASQLIMRVSESSLFHLRLKLLSGDTDDSPELSSYDIPQGRGVYAKLYPSMPEIMMEQQNCYVYTTNHSNSYRLITNGRPSTSITTILPSNHYRFSYPVFTFGKNADLKLYCNSHLTVNDSLLNNVSPSLIITAQEIQEASRQASNLTNHPVPKVIDTTKGVQLRCEEDSMKLTLDPAVTVQLKLEDLQPLKKNCSGFSSALENGNYVYSIPLIDCGGEIKKNGTTLTFTNSLVYASSLMSPIKYFSQVILTHSCSYSAGHSNYQKYTVHKNAFTSKTKGRVNLGVRLNVFSDDQYRQLLSNGGTISVSEGRKLFGDVSLTGINLNLKVALADCKVTPTRNSRDPQAHWIIENGCKTAYGVKVLSSTKFSVLIRSFVNSNSQNVYLHCTAIVCHPSDMSRCTHSCPNQNAVVGKRDADSPEIVHVSAGPFVIQ